MTKQGHGFFKICGFTVFAQNDWKLLWSPTILTEATIHSEQNKGDVLDRIIKVMSSLVMSSGRWSCFTMGGKRNQGTIKTSETSTICICAEKKSLGSYSSEDQRVITECPYPGSPRISLYPVTLSTCIT